MSLDVYLHGDPVERACVCADCGNEHVQVYWPTLYDANITHNLGGMADAAGIYQALWRPEEIGISKAGQLVEPLRKGLAWLEDHPDEAKKHNAPNGWGTYENFIPFVRNYLAACVANPTATVRASR